MNDKKSKRNPQGNPRIYKKDFNKNPSVMENSTEFSNYSGVQRGFHLKYKDKNLSEFGDELTNIGEEDDLAEDLKEFLA